MKHSEGKDFWKKKTWSCGHSYSSPKLFLSKGNNLNAKPNLRWLTTKSQRSVVEWVLELGVGLKYLWLCYLPAGWLGKSFLLGFGFCVCQQQHHHPCHRHHRSSNNSSHCYVSLRFTKPLESSLLTSYQFYCQMKYWMLVKVSLFPTQPLSRSSIYHDMGAKFSSVGSRWRVF